MRLHAARTGLTLIEVMIAIVVLAVGVLGAAGLQASALNATRTAEIVKQLDATARSELAVLRGQYLHVNEPVVRPCGREPVGCTVEIRPCLLDMAGDLDCTHAIVIDAAAISLTVSATRGDRNVTLRSLVLP